MLCGYILSSIPLHKVRAGKAFPSDTMIRAAVVRIGIAGLIAGGTMALAGLMFSNDNLVLADVENLVTMLVQGGLYILLCSAIWPILGIGVFLFKMNALKRLAEKELEEDV
jgi:hypothetical protein